MRYHDIVLKEFQLDRPLTWVEDGDDTIGTFSVKGQVYELTMMYSRRFANTGTGVARGAHVVFAAVSGTGRRRSLDTGNSGLLGTSSQIVFSHVISGIVQYCKKRDPDFISFVADRDNGKMRLYLRIISYLKPKLPQLGFLDPDLTNGPHDSEVVLWHNRVNAVAENATAGATSAASVATNIAGSTKGTIGVGFDANADKGIYQGKPKKQTSKASSVIRR